MKESSIDGKEFDGQSLSDVRLQASSYEECHFKHLELGKHDFRNLSFIDCEFESCNLSNVLFGNTALKEVRFTDCKILGSNFQDVNPFLLAMTFTNCKLELSSFRDLDLRASDFQECHLLEADFSGANLSKVLFDKCDLERAIFDNTILIKTNLFSSWGFEFDPSQNKTAGLVLAKNNLPGLLTRFGLDIRE